MWYPCLLHPCLLRVGFEKGSEVRQRQKVEMVPVKELLNLTGYIRGGCSPVGMKKKYPTFLDETCQLHEVIAVSAGERGHQMLLDPLQLADYLHAQLVDIIV